MNPKLLYVSIEGIVGAGKSSVLSGLQKHFPSSYILHEPLEDFVKHADYNPLLLAYENPMQNAAIAQLHIMRKSAEYYNQQISLIKENLHTDSAMVLSERSFESPKVFINNFHSSGIFSSFVRDYLLQEWGYMSTVNGMPSIVLYLDVNCPVALERIKRRNRAGEEGISLSYLESLSREYMKYLCSDVSGRLVIIVDVNTQTIDETVERIAKVLSGIMESRMLEVLRGIQTSKSIQLCLPKIQDK